MEAQTSVLNGIYSAFTLNKGFSRKDLVKCLNPVFGYPENLDEELLERDFYVSRSFLSDYYSWTWIFFVFMNSRDLFFVY